MAVKYKDYYEGNKMKAIKYEPAAIKRVRAIQRLRRDLGINLAGMAENSDLKLQSYCDRINRRIPASYSEDPTPTRPITAPISLA
jgi:hypothetical protein